MRSVGIISAETLNRGWFAVSNGNDTSLFRTQIDLKSNLVQLAVAIKVVGLRRQFDCLQGARVFFQRSRVAGGHYYVTRPEVRRDALQLCDTDDYVLCRSSMIRWIGHQQFQDFDSRCSL